MSDLKIFHWEKYGIIIICFWNENTVQQAILHLFAVRDAHSSWLGMYPVSVDVFFYSFFNAYQITKILHNIFRPSPLSLVRIRTISRRLHPSVFK